MLLRSLREGRRKRGYLLAEKRAEGAGCFHFLKQMNSLERFDGLLESVNKNYKQVNAKMSKLTAHFRSNLVPQEVGSAHSGFLLRS